MANHYGLVTLVVAVLWIAPCVPDVRALPNSETVAVPPSGHNFTLVHNGQSFFEALSRRADHRETFTQKSEAARLSSWTVKASCQTDHLCFAKTCDVIGESGQVKEGIHIGTAIIQGPRAPSEADALPCLDQPVAVTVCYRTAEESSGLFFLPDDDGASNHFVCFASTISSPSVAPVIDEFGHGCDTHIDLVLLRSAATLDRVGPYEFFVHVELRTVAANGRPVALVSQPAFFVLSRNVSVLVWGDHGGTLKTANEMLLMSGVAPDNLFCFHHSWPNVYDYVLRDTPCTRAQFPAALGLLLMSMIIHGSTPGVMGPNYSYLNTSSISQFLQWTSEFDKFDVIWIEMPNVHGLLFESFAKHKLVMRSSHRWDHGTPYYSAYPHDDALDWIRPALRQLVQDTAHISVATEWDYWYSRYHYCVAPERQLLNMPYAFLSSTAFSFESVSSVFLLWKGSNEDASDIMQSIGSAIESAQSQRRYPFVVQDRFSYVLDQTGGRQRRPSSMNVFQNARGIVYSGYSVGCSGLADLYAIGVPIIAPSVKFLMSLYDAQALSAFIYPPNDVTMIRKRNPTGIYHHAPNNIGCTDEDVHLEPCCSESSAVDDSSPSPNDSSPHQFSSCDAMRASRNSPEACSRESLVEWLPRIHTAVFPHIQQFDTVQELLDIMTDLATDNVLNLKIRQAMRQETMRLTLHNSDVAIRFTESVKRASSSTAESNVNHGQQLGGKQGVF